LHPRAWTTWRLPSAPAAATVQGERLVYRSHKAGDRQAQDVARAERGHAGPKPECSCRSKAPGRPHRFISHLSVCSNQSCGKLRPGMVLPRGVERRDDAFRSPLARSLDDSAPHWKQAAPWCYLTRSLGRTINFLRAFEALRSRLASRHRGRRRMPRLAHRKSSNWMAPQSLIRQLPSFRRRRSEDVVRAP